jgi:3'-phosphoadenosine 5'-phosphosulfate sulfotransferase (PAPS reductase)/FAD synthetase
MAKKDLLGKNTINTGVKEKSNRHIVCVSGGIASAVVAKWVKDNIDGEIIYYFNDVLWEDWDLYRFIYELETELDIKLMRDNDGRTPEQVFYDSKMLGSNRTPICSKILKAERLQQFVNNGDTVYFGIDTQEIHRAARITPIYERLGCKTVFPLIDNYIFRAQQFEVIEQLGIQIPRMYIDGFKHNNCGGGCVRAGANQWISLLKTYPEVYADRERIEVEFTIWNNARRLKKTPTYKAREYHFMKDISLKQLRLDYEKGNDIVFDDDEWQGECIGVCGSMN